MTRITEIVPDTNYQATQQFIADSQWAYQPVMDYVATQANSLIGDCREACLLLDETGFAKKGMQSVGVARQYLGNVGKVDNGQVAVMSALANRERVAIINTRLYLPEEWTRAPERCADADIPEECTEFKTKDQIAIELVDHALEQQLDFSFVGADAGYGKGLGFLFAMDHRHLDFMIDVHSDQNVYIADPKPYIPPGLGVGRQPTRYKTDAKPLTVKQWAQTRPKTQWRTISFRRGTKGKVTYRYLFGRVWVWDHDTGKTKLWHIVVRRSLNGEMDTCKYSLSNTKPQVSQERLAFMQGQRYWVERAFQDAKGHCGLADYQVRSWNAFHHHMALSMMALLFILTVRLECPDIPLLSCNDVEEVLAQLLPRRDTTFEQIIEIIRKRHTFRQRDLDMHAGSTCSSG